ncbi:fumarylacetoacetate hydrolase family protein [Baekduia sp. Peel2402]|uniref:fumarylacetoacetate hydrolase family protein n=1 Tax=Baekduia sp. Peel2402 TaxID=3458296 RepID=UPI00403E8EC3
MSDPRIAAGMARQLARRDAAIAGGASLRGWKVAFSTPAAQQAAGVNQPLVGWLADTSELPSGATIDVAGWTKPTVEAELAIHVGADVAPGGTLQDAAAAIAAVGTAIEVVDLDRPTSEVEDVTAAGLFHRHYVLGTADPARAGGDASGVTISGALDGETYNAQPDPTAIIGALAQVTRFVADELGRHGETLRAGEVILAGSALPLQPVAAGQRLDVDAGPLGTLTLTFA